MSPADRLASDLHQLSRSAADLAEVLGSGPCVPASAVLAAAVRVGELRRTLDALGDRLAGQAGAEATRLRVSLTPDSTDTTPTVAGRGGDLAP